ncbi:MAG: class II histone deacetylase [Nocardioidaceae bacterium]
MSTGWLWDERYAYHDTRAWVMPWQQPHGHPENPETKRRFANLVVRSGLERRLTRIEPREATIAELRSVHTPEYVERIVTESETGWGDVGDGETPFGPGSGTVARLAAGGVIACIDAVLGGAVSNAYALVRPPGHHAFPGGGMGYCLFNNTAIGVRHSQRVRGVERVAIVDWDVHHGNGTETIFYQDPTVMTVSLHQENLYPVGRGLRSDNGVGPGRGANVNIPLPAGSGSGAYVAAMDRVVVPALERFRPELIIISSGFDSAAMDPFGRQVLHSGSYRALTSLLMDAADELCEGRILAVHEGGYDPLMGPFCGLAVVETLAGETTPVTDPWMASIAELPEQNLLPHHEYAVARAMDLLADVPARA